jgi:hypothetical protein
MTAVAAWTPQYDSDETINVRTYATIREGMPSGVTPMRIIEPMSPGEFAFIALGKTNKTTWRLVDTLYIKPVSQGDGIKSEATHMVNYADAYRQAMYDHRAVTSVAIVTGATIEPGVYPWNDVQYFGVKCTVTIEDFLSPA